MLDQIKCLTTACDELGLSYAFFDDNQNCVRVTMKHGELFFVNSATSYNREADAQIAEDKYFTYKLCHDVITMPTTRAYVDPSIPPQYKAYAIHPSYATIADDIAQHFELPVVVKRNRGSRGDNVFLCNTPSEILHAVKAIFNHKAKNYDYVALAETYVPIVREFRAVTFRQKLVLLYEKEKSNATFSGNLSPLHWKNAKAVPIDDQVLHTRITSFLQPFFTKLPLSYVGFDIALLSDQSLCLIEANTKPGFDYFIRDNGPQEIVEMYTTILTENR